MIKNTYAEYIKNIRLAKGFSQATVAEKIGVSRTQYIAIEQGKRELSLAESQKLTVVLGVTTENLENGELPNYEKYKQMILQYLRFAGSGSIKKTKLAKLLYLADFAWYYENLKSMSGMEYRRIQFGPVPDSYFRAIDELENEGKISIDRSMINDKPSYSISELDGNSIQKLSSISDREATLMREIFKKWKNKNTSEIVNFTHEQLPYKLCSPDEVIPYDLIIQVDPEYVY